MGEMQFRESRSHFQAADGMAGPASPEFGVWKASLPSAAPLGRHGTARDGTAHFNEPVLAAAAPPTKQQDNHAEWN